MPITLSEVRQCAELSGSEHLLVLDPGTHEVTSPIRIRRSGVSLCGATQAGRLASSLKRGKHPDGTIYDGPLISIDDQSDITIFDLVVEGSRFEHRNNKPTFDRRHPLSSDPSSARFPCGSILPAPQCFDHSTFVSNTSADISASGATNLSFRNMILKDAIRIGVAVGRNCSNIQFSDVHIGRAGDYGLWAGYGFSNSAPLPLDADTIAAMPTRIRAERCFFERCGDAAVYVEANDIAIIDAIFICNHCDFPYNDEGGQFTVDYRADNVRLERCMILGGPTIEREGAVGDGENAKSKTLRLLGTTGIECSGSNIFLKDVIIEGNSREALQLNGARNVFIGGARTRFINNNLASVCHPTYPGNAGRQGISITTTSYFSKLNAMSSDICLEEIQCENGVCVWSNGSVPQLNVDGLTVKKCDLSGPNHSGIWVGNNPDGSSIQGEHWSIDQASEQ
jgi:hypothetical protein